MRRTAPKINPTRVPLLSATLARDSGRRRFPAWIEAEDPIPSVTFDPRIVLPRIRAALPLRRIDPVTAKADTAAGKRKQSHGRRGY